MDELTSYRHVEGILHPSEVSDLIKFFNLERESFVDVPQKVKYFKYPSKVAALTKRASSRITLPHVTQLTMMEPQTVSSLHKDQTKFNDFDSRAVPRVSVISYPILPLERCAIAQTEFYSDTKQKIGETDYGNNDGAILNVGERYHQVRNLCDSYRVTLQFCFSERYEDILKVYESHQLIRT